MSKNPVVNALLALGYITLVATVMQLGAKVSRPEDTFLAPVAFVSVFTLSAAMMAYIFGFQPVTMYLDGKKKEAVKLALQTLAIFGVITAVLLAVVFSGVLPGKDYLVFQEDLANTCIWKDGKVVASSFAAKNIVERKVSETDSAKFLEEAEANKRCVFEGER